MSKVRHLVFLVFLGCALVPANAGASGGTYDVVFCHELHRGFGGTIDSTNAFSARNFCSDPQNSSAVKIENVDRTAEGRSATVHWEVDDPLGITGVQVEGRLRRANGYSSDLFMADSDGQRTHVVATGESSPSEFEAYEWHGKPQQQFFAKLQCTLSPSCPASEPARTWVRSLRFTVADGADPVVDAVGGLLDGGWLRGSADVRAEGHDAGSGIADGGYHRELSAHNANDALRAPAGYRASWRQALPLALLPPRA